ncbi:MAG: septum site-determining protein MinC [Methylococcales bacterium]|nr:septum site-determining protein MinC [Methylococcales bacterium]
MLATTPLHIVSKTTLEFKSSSFNIPVLVLNSDSLLEIKKELHEKISQAPDFFKHSPLIIDLNLAITQYLDIQTLIETLRQLQLFPIGVQGGTSKQHETATNLGLPLLSVRLLNNLKLASQPPSNNETSPPQIEAIENKLITSPVRSGQRIYSKGDLTILAQVSAGAEVMAEGSIHIYASLRGRALAGVQGNIHSRIFCSDLQPELISIAGNYRVRDDLETVIANKAVQIFLQKKSLIIQPL